MPEQAFTVSRFENRNGSTSWRVSGLLAGVRIRKNFKTREEAAAEKAALEIRAFQACAGMRIATTFLSDSQLRDAETAFRRIADRGQSLGFYLDFALANYREPARQQALEAAVADYLESKRRDQSHDLLSLRQLRSISRELACLQRFFPKAPVSHLTAARLTPYFERNQGSPKTFNNRRGIVGTFLKFCYQRDWIEANPLDKIPHRRIAHRRGSATTISAIQAAELMRHVEGVYGGVMVPYFALCLFAGIRPSLPDGEIAKLQAASVSVDAGTIRIDADVSKVRMKRIVEMPENLVAWLKAYPLDHFPIVPKNAKNYRRHICTRFGLTHDVMRHTFISMHVAKHRSMGEAALQAGNSESIIRKHYLDLKTKEEAEAFFAILPVRPTSLGAEPTPFTAPEPASAEPLAKAS